MPRMDGTGPQGLGPLSGKKRGNCQISAAEKTEEGQFVAQAAYRSGRCQPRFLAHRWGRGRGAGCRFCR